MLVGAETALDSTIVGIATRCDQAGEVHSKLAATAHASSVRADAERRAISARMPDTIKVVFAFKLGTEYVRGVSTGGGVF